MINALFVLMAVLTLCDHASTVYFHKHTTLKEGNPLLAKIIAKFGMTGLFFAKAAVVAVLGLIHYIDPLPWQVLTLLCSMYAGVVIWNVLQIRKATLK